MTEHAPAIKPRGLSIGAYVAIVVAYVVIVQGLGVVFTIGFDRGDYAVFTTSEQILRSALLPILVSIAFGAGIVTWLGWWPAALRDDRAAERWVRAVPITMLVTALLVTNYGNLADQPTGLIVTAVVLVLAVGVGEELMFRGLGVVALRRAGFTEFKVALYTSLMFGAVHLTNALTSGSKAILQAAIVSVAGYFFYLTRRATGGLLAPILLHALWDFSLFSSTLGDGDTTYPPAVLSPLCIVGLSIFVWRRRKLIGATPPVPGAPEPAAAG